MTTVLENKFETSELINNVMDKIAQFVVSDEETKDDYKEYLKTFGGNEVATTIPYIFERRLNNKSIPDIFLKKNKNTDKETKDIVKAFSDSMSSIFEVKRILKNKFLLFNLIDEQMYTIISPIKMTAFRGLGVGNYIVARFFNYEKENYMIEMSGVYPSSKKDIAYKYAISKILSNPELVYKNNKNIKNKIEKKAKFSYDRFNELFGSDEITTSNKNVDDLIEYLNGSIENLDWKSKIENVDMKEFFDVSSLSNSNMMQNAGFSTYSKPFDVTLIVDEKWGFYAIPFYKTFCDFIEGKDIKNSKEMVNYFLTANVVAPNILRRIEEKHPKMMEVINSVNENLKTLDDLISEYKQKQTYSITTVLEECPVFVNVLDSLEQPEEDTIYKNIGRNDPCPCGSGLKYKKCCMPR